MNAARPWEANWIRDSGSAIGRGGQGHAFLMQSRHDASKKAVLKLQIDRKQKDPVARRRMFQEVSSLKVLASAGADVPHVLDDNTGQFGDLSVSLFFVMEYIPGPTLAQYMKEKGPLPLRQAVGISLSLLTTLEIAFKEGIVHRDLKPENMIVREFDPPALAVVDFGLSFNAEDDDAITRADEALENNFLSLPERRGNQENKRDPRSDITSVCAILFYCITGSVPKHLRDSQGRPPHRWEHSLPSKFVPDQREAALVTNVLERGLQYEVDLRFQSTGELRTRLGELLDPHVKVPAEDLLDLATRQSALLRRQDRRTQLAELRHACRSLNDHLSRATESISRRLATATRFQVTKMGDPKHFGIKPPEVGDDVGVSSDTMIGVSEHELVYHIAYWVYSTGLEGVVYRSIWRAPSKPGLFNAGAPSAENVLPWEMVLRFNASGAELQIVAADLERAVATVLPLITHDVCNGVAPRNAAEEILRVAFPKA